MPAEPGSLALAADFPTATREQWRALVTQVLAKSGLDESADPEDALSHTTYDDIAIRPLYTADDASGSAVDGRPGRPPFVRGALRPGESETDDDASGWDIRTRHAGTDAATVNAAVLQDLERGATSLWLGLGDGGLPVRELSAALADVYLDLAPIVLDAGVEWQAASRALLDLARNRSVDPAALRGSLGLDPIGAHARSGAPADDASITDAFGTAVGLVADAPQLRIATVDATVYHDAGASDAQEIGIATSIGVTYVRALTAAGLSVDDALRRVEFRWAMTAEQFGSIAKLRAARRVWDRVAQLSEASDDRAGQAQHAVTSAAMLTRRDPWVNMLRATIACFAAAVGGAESITVAPFDAAIGVSDDFARRIARNTQAILHDESSLARVTDAAGGSWFVESLTDELAGAAWAVFTDLERSGGALAGIGDGTVEELLAATRARRDDDIAHRRAPITGVSEFAFVDEDPVRRDASPASADGPLPRIRYAAEFEALRDRADAAGVRPTVSIVALGTTQNSPRVAFVRNLFNAGGIGTDVIEAKDFTGGVVCVSGDDRLYADEGTQCVQDLRDRGARHVWVAGRADVGADGQVYSGCDALEALRTTFDALGVA